MVRSMSRARASRVAERCAGDQAVACRGSGLVSAGTDEHVERRARQASALTPRGLVHDQRARRVDQEGGWFHQRQRARVDRPTSPERAAVRLTTSLSRSSSSTETQRKPWYGGGSG